MNEFLIALRQFFRGFRCWLVVSPWEAALLVRLGKRVRRLEPGFHWKIPILDVIYLQSVRLRLSPLPKQTISTLCSRVITVAGSLGYQIDDIEKLYASVHHGEDTVKALARAQIAEYVSTHRLEECEPEKVQAAVNARLELARYGLGAARIYITDFAVVRTYRLIGDHSEYGFGTPLTTDKPCTSTGDPT